MDKLLLDCFERITGFRKNEDLNQITIYAKDAKLYRSGVITQSLVDAANLSKKTIDAHVRDVLCVYEYLSMVDFDLSTIYNRHIEASDIEAFRKSLHCYECN